VKERRGKKSCPCLKYELILPEPPASVSVFPGCVKCWQKPPPAIAAVRRAHQDSSMLEIWAELCINTTLAVELLQNYLVLFGFGIFFF